MIERPLLMSGPMVQAILAGRKSQTRRVMKPQPQNGAHIAPLARGPDHGPVTHWAQRAPDVDGTILHIYRCPYGEPGDRLWIRESFQFYFGDGRQLSVLRPERLTDRDAVVKYKADSTETQADRDRYGTLTWRPSIHMPRWASRLTLAISGVRVERLNDISEADAKAEGVEIPTAADPTYRCKFQVLWDALNRKRGYGWQVNPWVWVLDFTVVTSPAT